MTINHHHRTTMTRLLLPLLLLTTPASAQTFWPNLAGARYCQLRAMGIDAKQAVDIAMRENWRPNAQPTMVEYQGQMVALEVLDMAGWAARCGG